MSIHVYQDGILRQHWDDTTRTFSAWNIDGTAVPGTPRPYTVEENTRADAEAAESAEQAAHEAQRIIVRAIITDLQDEKTRVDAVIAKSNAQITGGDTKDVARAAKRIADAAIDLARLVKDV